MRRQFLLTSCFSACLLPFLFAFLPAHAADGPPSTADAQAMVKKAVAFIKANGKQRSLDEINQPKGQFVERELYVFVLDKQGTTLANGVNPKIVGVNVIDMKDADGKPFIREILKMANEKGNGWQDYKWPDPVQKTIRNKSSYVEKIDDWYVCAGIYK